MNFIYPERPKKEILREMKKKVECQLERLGLDFDELNEEEKKRAKVQLKNIPDKFQDVPTLSTYLTLFALAWRYWETKEDRTVKPWMSAMQVQSLCLDLTDNAGVFWPRKKPSRMHPLHEKTIYRCLEAFEKEKIAKAEEVGKNRFRYSIAVPRGFHVLGIWEEKASRKVWHWDREGLEGSGVYGFLGAINGVFNLMLKRFLRFQAREDFKTLERYVVLSLKHLRQDFCAFQENSEANLPTGMWSDVEVAIDWENYFSHEPSQVLNSFEKLKGLDGKPFLQEDEGYISHWPECIKVEDKKNFALVCASSIYLENLLYENHRFVAAFNMCLFWAEVVTAVKKRFAGKMVG